MRISSTNGKGVHLILGPPKCSALNFDNSRSIATKQLYQQYSTWDMGEPEPASAPKNDGKARTPHENTRTIMVDRYPRRPACLPDSDGSQA